MLNQLKPRRWRAGTFSGSRSTRPPPPPPPPPRSPPPPTRRSERPARPPPGGSIPSATPPYAPPLGYDCRRTGSGFMAPLRFEIEPTTDTFALVSVWQRGAQVSL